MTSKIGAALSPTPEGGGLRAINFIMASFLLKVNDCLSILPPFMDDLKTR